MAGPPLPPAPAPLAAPVPAAPMPHPAPPPRHPRRLRPRRGGGWLVPGSWGLGGDELAGVRVDVVEVVVVVVVVVVGVVRRHLLGGMHLIGCTSGCGGARPRPPSLRPTLPPGFPCPVLPVPWGPRRPFPCPWAPSQPPARAAGPASQPPRPGPPAHPPPLALPPAPGLPARAPVCPSRSLAPSRPPALSCAVCCLRSAPPRCCALAPCRACPGLLLALAPGHFPCRLLPRAPRSRGWHAALPAHPPALPESRAGRTAVFAAAAA